MFTENSKISPFILPLKMLLQIHIAELLEIPTMSKKLYGKSRIAQFVRSRHLSNKPADMTAAAMKSLQTLRNFAIISMGSKTNDDEDSLPEEQYRDFMGFLDEESYKFRRILNKQKMEKPAAKDAKKRAEMLRAVNPTLAEVGNGNNTTTTTDVVLSDGEPCSDKDEIIARGDLTELKRVRQTVFQVAKGLWQRFQISQILLDYKGDFRNSEAAKDFYLKEVARRRWPTANLARSLNGVLAQFRVSVSFFNHITQTEYLKFRLVKSSLHLPFLTHFIQCR
ncbi:unnamed protein product [Anisakis simplex]|uniref:DUF5601 domain-containing protein n=1 Tax=Anisakis simplex TaxID=6269 RepID=A0A0M3KFA9_ANISI|nr:unnamed protein product [Anisakis simplex]